jgi:hypothetical protein
MTLRRRRGASAELIDKLAEQDIDPIRKLNGSEFFGAYSPDLKLEYEAALSRGPDRCGHRKPLICCR